MRFVTLIAELIEWVKEEIEHRQLEKKYRKQLKFPLDKSDKYSIIKTQQQKENKMKIARIIDAVAAFFTIAIPCLGFMFGIVALIEFLKWSHGIGY